MTYDEGVDFFVKEGYQSRESSIVEAKRGTSDPTYLYYTLGKLEILKLRADVQKQQGTASRCGNSTTTLCVRDFRRLPSSAKRCSEIRHQHFSW